MNISCNGGNDGEISTIVTNSTGPCSYVWKTYSYPNTTSTLSNTGNSLTDGTAGNYIVIVTDSLGNTDVDTVVLQQPHALHAGIDPRVYGGGTNISEFGAQDGAMTSDISGGVTPYTYLWQPGSHTAYNYLDVAAGQYTLTVTDAAGCEDEAQITLTEPDEFTVELELIEIAPGYHIVACADVDSGRAIVTPTGGVAPYAFDWANSETTATALALGRGAQHMHVTDANGVRRTVEFDMVATPAMEVQLTVSDTFPSGYHISCWYCADASVQASITGGNAPFTYQWYKGQTNGTASITNAREARYDLTVIDAYGCIADGTAKLRIPERDDWNVNGNPGLNAEGQPKWLGTTDETDLMLKANNQPALRVGADGNVDVLGQLRVPGLAVPVGSPPAAIGVDGYGNFAYLNPELVGAECNETSSIGQWSYGTDKIVTFCDRTDVGIGMTQTEQPKAKLEVRGLTQVQGIKIGGAPNGQGLFENLEFSLADIRGKTIIGYQDDIGPAYANANLDVRSDGDQIRYTFETRDNDGNSSFRVRNNGKVVIGAENFDTPQSGYAALYFGNENLFIGALNGVGTYISSPAAPLGMALLVSETDGGVRIPLTASIGGVLTSNSPHYYDSKLSVNGKLVAKEIFVTTANWADDVFRPGYRLMPLHEVAAYIKTNGHLPDVPTEAEIKATGQNLAEVNAILLRKIEELTLHIIELEKKGTSSEFANAELRRFLEVLTDRITDLESRIGVSGKY
jgi:hypothetical protein